MGNFKLSEKFPRLYHLERDIQVVVNDRGNWEKGEWKWVWNWNREPRGRMVGELEEMTRIISNCTPVNQHKDKA